MTSVQSHLEELKKKHLALRLNKDIKEKQKNEVETFFVVFFGLHLVKPRKFALLRHLLPMQQI